MNTSTDAPKLDTCGCCEAEAPQPARDNRPGQPALAYRLGTHASFLRRMLARLHTQVIPDGPTLAALATRASDDPAIAVLDAWATVGDVLTFYQERIANEGYLRTATERRSVLELARTIGYELNPGVAASTYLAFTVEDAPGAPGQVAIDKGIKVLSVPGQDEKPQTFETIERIEARAEWNAMRPQQSELKIPRYGSKEVYLKGVDTGLRPGDPLLFIGKERREDRASERWDFRRVNTVMVNSKLGHTKVTWKEGLGWARFGRRIRPAEKDFTVYTFRQRVALFGHNAPDWRAMTKSVKEGFLKPNEELKDYNDWPRFNLDSDDTIHLDAVYPQIIPDSWVVLSVPDYEEVYDVVEAEEESREDFTLTAKTTRLKLRGENLIEKFGKRRRDVRVFAQSEQLELAEQPITTPVSGNKIVLDRSVQGLKKGRTLIVSGKPITGGPAAEDDETVSEVAFVEEMPPDQKPMIIALKYRLKNSYDRATVKIYANVVGATHGETVKEVLGSGDGTQANQSFKPKKPSLTYVSAPTPSGAKSTLEVRVNDVLWQEVSSLYGLDARSQSYIVRIEDDGTTRVIFGDGERGARLPSGMENVVANYRTGIGPDGEVDAGRLTLLQTRPLGVREVTNPRPATGAAAPETLDEARTNAPMTVLTLDRIVSLRDFEDFTRAFAGVGKAQAVALWNGETRLVHITVATAKSDPIDPNSALYTNLRKAIDAARDPTQQVEVAGYQPCSFSLKATVLVDPRYSTENVLAHVRSALQKAFGFAKRAFGQPVTAAEVTAVMQAVKGVIAVVLDRLALDDLPARVLPFPIITPIVLQPILDLGVKVLPTWVELSLDPKRSVPPTAILQANIARWEHGTIQPAELLLLNPDGISLKGTTA